MFTINIQDYGAIGDGITLNTLAIQNAIEACAKEGGGRVVVGKGTYLTGKLVLRDYVELHIESNGTLLASPDPKDFPESSDEEASHVDSNRLTRWRNNCILFANECHHISITGDGTIDCNGDRYVVPCNEPPLIFKQLEGKIPGRAVFFTGCSHVKVEGITLLNPPAGWAFWIHDCDFVSFSRCKLLANPHYPNTDGIHLNCSRNVTISDCDMVLGDDCIIVRANSASLKENKPTEKVTVTNCNLTSYANGIRVGWTNDGIIRNCVFSNIVMTDCSYGIGISLPFTKRKDAGDGVNITFADVGREETLVENISFQNIVMDRMVRHPVDINIADHPEFKVQGIRNIYFHNVHASGVLMPQILGQKQCPVENVTFSDCSFRAYDGHDIENLFSHSYGSMTQEEIAAKKTLTLNNTRNVVFHNTSFTTE